LKMIDIQDRRYLAQCIQQLSTSSLANLLDLLLDRHSSEIVERKGGESYHIDFGTLSPLAYADAREFIKRALGDDDDFGLRERKLSQRTLATGGGKSEDIVKEMAQVPVLSESASQTIATQSQPQVPAQNRSSFDSTPAPPYPNPTNGVIDPLHLVSSASSLDVNSASPEKNLAKLKRVRLSSEEKPEQLKKEDRYYNGERVWRHPTDDLRFNFHGIDVVLLSLTTKTKRPWSCGVCQKVFVSKDKIVNHVQQHSGEKIHECPTCLVKFSSKHYLKEHQKRVHLFHCHYCDAVFDSFDSLQSHSGQVHPKQTALKACSCRKGCKNSRCSCYKNGLNCNANCQCFSCNNAA